MFINPKDSPIVQSLCRMKHGDVKKFKSASIVKEEQTHRFNTGDGWDEITTDIFDVFVDGKRVFGTGCPKAALTYIAELALAPKR